MITIIDYGLGNVQAFTNMYKRLGFDVCRATNAAELKGATKLILPGVGESITLPEVTKVSIWVKPA